WGGGWGGSGGGGGRGGGGGSPRATSSANEGPEIPPTACGHRGATATCAGTTLGAAPDATKPLHSQKSGAAVPGVAAASTSTSALTGVATTIRVARSNAAGRIAIPRPAAG